MTTNDPNAGNPNSERPSLTGIVGPDYEQPNSVGGSGPREFVPPSQVKDIFSRGLDILNERLEAANTAHHVSATMARVRLHPNAIAKSHRHPTLFDVNRFQVAGVQQPGDILALATRRSLAGLAELVEGATPNQMRQLSSVAEITPYEIPIESGDRRSVISLFDGVLDDGTRLRERGLESFENLGFELSPYGKSNVTFTASSLPPESSLRDMPWLRGVRPVSGMRLATTLDPQVNYPGALLYANQILPLPIVGIIDSGIDPAIPGLAPLVVFRQSHLPAAFADQRHGSLVGALAATGGGFTQDPNHFPTAVARLLDVQVFGTGQYEVIDEDDLLIAVENAVLRFGPRSVARPNEVDQPVAIWNLSMSQTTAAQEDSFSPFAVELDRIANENNVIFTVPSGNYSYMPLRGWLPNIGPDEDLAGEDRVAPPADAALAVSVGSLSDSNDPPSAAPVAYPSPFSRRGPGPGMLIKPDVVHFGGTCGKNGEQVHSIRGPHLNGAAADDIGTSFAAPKVAAQIAQLVNAIPNPDPELLKLLVLLSCASLGDHNNSNRESVNYYGFGFPNSPVDLLSCNVWECTILFCGEIRPGRPLRVPFPFPSCLENNGQRRGFIRMALVYNPVLDPSKGSEYCQTNVSASLGREFFDPNDNSRSYKREVLPLPHHPGSGAQLERDLIEHSWKWSPTKVYEREFKRMQVHPNEIGWRLSFDLLLRRELELSREDVRQKFWFGLRIADPDHASPVYQEMRQQIQSSGLAQPITLRPQIGI